MEPSATPEIIIGLDVGKTGHHACALTNTGERIYDKPLPQDDAARREIFASMQAHGSVVMVVTRSAPCPSPWPATAAARSETSPT